MLWGLKLLDNVVGLDIDGLLVVFGSCGAQCGWTVGSWA
jgi:hypothetical protein